MKVYLATTNQKKLDTAQKVLSKYQVDLEILNIETEIPEIQEYDSAKIAAFSAEYTATLTQKLVLVTDVGYFITTLKGFPRSF